MGAVTKFCKLCNCFYALICTYDKIGVLYTGCLDFVLFLQLTCFNLPYFIFYNCNLSVRHCNKNIIVFFFFYYKPHKVPNFTNFYKWTKASLHDNRVMGDNKTNKKIDQQRSLVFFYMWPFLSYFWLLTFHLSRGCNISVDFSLTIPYNHSWAHLC